MTQANSKPDVIFFDVNETLLDLSALRPHFETVFGSSEPMEEWFARLLHGSLVSNYVRHYRPFGVIGVEALMVVADKRGIGLDTESAARIVAGMKELPTHPEVPAALRRLRDSGYRLATLTNGATEAATAQLSHADIAGLFDRSISVDEIGIFKPAPEVYQHAITMLDVDPDRALMVAAHYWDILGARAVGIPGAFLARPGVVWGVPDPPPDLVAGDLSSLADRLV